MTGQKNRASSLFSRKLEAFALNLLHLIRGVRVYPTKHPTLLEVAKNVLHSAPLDAQGSLKIGITSHELVVGGEFVAGKASSLASMLHARKILHLLWTKNATLEDVWAFAKVISTPRLEGQALREKLRCDVCTIDIEPLKLEQIHSKVTGTVRDTDVDPERRRRQAWLCLMSHEAPADQLASALASKEFWEAAREEWIESGYGDSEGFAQFLLTLGERLEDALAFLPDGQRDDILDYLTQMGKCLSVRDLVRIVGREGQESKRLRLGKASLLREIDGERFIDLLAGLAAMGDQGTHRFVEVYRRFAPVSQTQDLLSLVRARLSQAKDSEFSVEIWKTVEHLILNLTENPFMEKEYADSLEFLVNPSDLMSSEDDTLVLQEDPDEHVDRLFLALAMEEEPLRSRLLERIKARTEQVGPLRVLGFVRWVDRTIPELLNGNPYFVRDLFQKGLSALPGASFVERQALIQFTVHHERCLLDTVLKALSEEKKSSTRYFLVNLLSCFSLASTPAFVTRARTGPWYVARNLAIVLGQQGFPQVLPPLRSLSTHAHPKVKREVLRALKKVQSSLEPFRREQVKNGLGDPNLRHYGRQEMSYGAECS